MSIYINTYRPCTRSSFILIEDRGADCAAWPQLDCRLRPPHFQASWKVSAFRCPVRPTFFTFFFLFSSLLGAGDDVGPVALQQQPPQPQNRSTT